MSWQYAFQLKHTSCEMHLGQLAMWERKWGMDFDQGLPRGIGGAVPFLRMTGTKDTIL